MRRSLLLLPALIGAGCSPPDTATPGTDAGTSVPVDCRTAPAREGTYDPGVRTDGGAQVQLPALTGRLGVSRGARHTVYEPNRDELDTPAMGDKRSISVEVWFPTDVCGTGPSPDVFSDAEATAMGIVFTDPWWRSAVSHTTAGAPFVQDGQRHPVLLFSPGYNASPRTYTLLLEQLVSHGYVVAVISHTFWAPLTFFGANGVPGFHSPGGLTFEIADEESEVWLHDGIAALDALAEWDANDPEGQLTGRLDLERVGALGHSFGGAMALNVLATDARLKAGANLDGSQFGRYRDAGFPALQRPSLIFYSARANDPTLEAVHSAATGPAWALKLAESGHLTFSDYALIGTQLGGTFAPAYFGTINPARANAAITTWVVGFFDRALKGEAVPLLDGASADWPEVEVRRRN